jgi:hypothetical protein
MSSTISPVAVKALKLAPVQRMGLAALLLDSLEADGGVEKRLLRELTKRAAELRSGKVKGMTTQEAYGFSL